MHERSFRDIGIRSEEAYNMKNAFGKDVLGFLVDIYWNVLELAERSS
jgi:hypothetical protein